VEKKGWGIVCLGAGTVRLAGAQLWASLPGVPSSFFRRVARPGLEGLPRLQPRRSHRGMVLVPFGVGGRMLSSRAPIPPTLEALAVLAHQPFSPGMPVVVL